MNSKEKRPPKNYLVELATSLALAAKQDPEYVSSALIWTIIGITITLFFSIFFGSLSVFLSVGLSLSWALLFFCFIIALTLTLMLLFLAIRFRYFFAFWINRLLSSKGDTIMADESKFNPLGWGILFFTFWLSIMTIPGLREQTMTLFVAWLSLGLSVLMLISIEPHLRDWLNKPRVKRHILTWVFYVTFLSFAITYISSVGIVDPTIRLWVIIIGFLWFMVFFIILISKLPKTVGIITCLIFLGFGVYYLISQQTDNGRITAVGFGIIAIITLVCSIVKPKWLSEISLI